MKLYRIRFVIPALLLMAIFPRLSAQEAIEITPDSVTAEPTPIEEQKPDKPKKKKEVEETSGARELERSGKSIQEMMSGDEFKKAGLDKLSASELKSLDAWLQGYRQTTETKASEKATAEATKKTFTRDKIFTRVDGMFYGLNGHTIIKLEDGTTWKQAMKDDKLQANITDHPPVMVSHSGFGFKMRVVGTGEFYVNPVR